MSVFLHKINLSHFRNYAALRLELSGAPAVILTGANGAGKTNILEAVSLLTPGKGLRGAEMTELNGRDGTAADCWALAAEVETADGMTVRIGTGLDRQKKKRVVRIDGKDVKAQSTLSNYLSAVWLTPQMDRLFVEGASERRRFLDRLVFSYAPSHAGHVSRYEKNMRARLRLLETPRHDARWVNALEEQLAADAVVIAVARQDLLERLAGHAQNLQRHQVLFPAPQISLTGFVEARLGKKPAVDIEDEFRETLRNNRAMDAEKGRTHAGAHRSDFDVTYAAKNMPAAQCSTGEQKALLISIILAHAQMMLAEKGHVPVLLLDEVAAHLDDARRAQLFEFLMSMRGQVFLTGTDESIFSQLRNDGLFVRVGGNMAVPHKLPPKLGVL